MAEKKNIFVSLIKFSAVHFKYKEDVWSHICSVKHYNKIRLSWRSSSAVLEIERSKTAFPMQEQSVEMQVRTISHLLQQGFGQVFKWTFFTSAHLSHLSFHFEH